MRKVNLSDIQQELVSRGRKPFTDSELEQAIFTLSAMSMPKIIRQRRQSIATE